jgi:hypothetical protein
MNHTTSLADALRERAKYLDERTSNSSCLEYVWGDKKNVIAALLETADVIDSWSGEYLSKELTYKENERRRWSTTHPSNQKPMTMEERRAAVKKLDSIRDL